MMMCYDLCKIYRIIPLNVPCWNFCMTTSGLCKLGPILAKLMNLQEIFFHENIVNLEGSTATKIPTFYSNWDMRLWITKWTVSYNYSTSGYEANKSFQFPFFPV